MIETCIYQELPKLKQEDENNPRNNIAIEKVQQVRKFKLGDKTFESILVDNEPYFITTSDDETDGENSIYTLQKQIDVSSNTFLPADNITTINPLLYSFESETELKHFLEKAKHETFDTLFTKVLTEFKRYVSVDEHVSTILSADIIYSYFQDRFGTTHYNIFIGENGSGKNSALLVFKHLGYRVFYVTAASAANYYTFLGDIQEGQGTIAEDEADDIGEDKVKQRILKTGYASGGTVPKIEFSRNGKRSQKPYLTFCHKWFAMEEIPDERKIRGVLDRSFIFKFLAGEVEHNIKDVEQAENSELYEKIVDLRKTLFAFKFLHQSDKFEDVHINIKNRNAELTKPLLRLFENSKAQEQIRKALEVLIKEKSQIKSNSIEVKILEALNALISEDNEEGNKEVYQFTNEQIFQALKKAMDGLENQFDGTYSTFITPDGLYVSKKKIKQILVSKFNAVPDKVNINSRTERVIRISKKWLDKLGKQYEVIEGINFVDDNGFCEGDTMADVTVLESASPDFDKEFDDAWNKAAEDEEGNDNTQTKIDKTDLNINPTFANVNQIEEHSKSYTNCDLKSNFLDDLNSTEEKQEEARMGPQDPSAQHRNSISKVQNNETYNGEKPSISNANQLDKPQDDEMNNNSIKDILDDNQSTKNTENIEQALPESVTSVTSVTKTPALSFYYHCHFCPEYSTEIEDELDRHKLEKHKRELLKDSKRGWLSLREQELVDKIKMTMKETSRILDEMISESIDFILSHFSHQLNLFPRKMMTDHRKYQFTVYSKEEVIEYCKQANYIDVRINAYPEYVEYKGIIRQQPDFIFIDLDLTNFNNNIEKTNEGLKRIKNKIDKLGGSSTILWTGNGYHVYLPLEALVLDQIDIFSKENFPSLFQSNFGKYYGYSVSEVFLKFAKEYFSIGKADPLHHPKYGNSLARIPGTYNSKCLNRGLSKEESKVKIIQKWDGKKLPIQLLLKDFRR